MNKKLKPLEWCVLSDDRRISKNPLCFYATSLKNDCYKVYLCMHTGVIMWEEIFSSKELDVVEEFAFNHYKQQVEDLYE